MEQFLAMPTTILWRVPMETTKFWSSKTSCRTRPTWLGVEVGVRVRVRVGVRARARLRVRVRAHRHGQRGEDDEYGCADGEGRARR